MKIVEAVDAAEVGLEVALARRGAEVAETVIEDVAEADLALEAAVAQEIETITEAGAIIDVTIAIVRAEIEAVAEVEAAKSP